jgi:hypothetical protein
MYFISIDAPTTISVAVCDGKVCILFLTLEPMLYCWFILYHLPAGAYLLVLYSTHSCFSSVYSAMP